MQVLSVEQKTTIKLALAVHILKTRVSNVESDDTDSKQESDDSAEAVNEKLKHVQRQFVNAALRPNSTRIGHQSSDILFWLVKNSAKNGQEQQLCEEVRTNGGIGSLIDRLLGLLSSTPELCESISDLFLQMADEASPQSPSLIVIAERCVRELLVLGRSLRRDPRADPSNIIASYCIFRIFERLLIWAHRTGKTKQQHVIACELCTLLQRPQGEISPLFVVRVDRLLNSTERHQEPRGAASLGTKRTRC
jgi:hypothetical protein